jgi:PAS domain S-box-containing protein
VGAIHKIGPAAATASRRIRLLDAAADFAVFADPTGAIVFATTRTQTLVPQSGVSGTKVWEVVHPEDRTQTERMFEAARLEGVSRGDIRVDGSRGEPRWLSLRLSLVRDGTSVFGVDVVGHDVTEDRWLLDSLERRNEELRAFLAATTRIALVTDPSALAAEVVETALDLFPHASTAKIWLTNDEGDLSLVAARGRLDGPLEVPIAALKSLTRTTPLVVEQGGARVSSTGSGSAIYLGLSAGDRPIGCLALEAKGGSVLDLADAALLQSFASHVSMALANAQAHGIERRNATERAAMLDHIAEGLLVVDASARIERMNPAAERVLGVERAQFTGRSIRDLLPNLEREDGAPLPDEERPILRALHRGETVTDVRLIVARGPERRTFSVSAAPIRDGSGTIRGAIAVFRDVTEDRDRARQLQRYAHALSQFSDGVAILDRGGVVVDWIGDAGDLLGWQAKEVVGQRFSDLLTGSDADAARTDFESAITDGIRLEREVRLWSAEGTARTCLVTCSPVSEEDGRSLGSVVVTKDVTEDRLLRERLSRSQRLEALGRLAAGVAHEVNNPLAFLAVNLEVLERTAASGKSADDPLVAEVREVLPDLREGVRRIRDVVRSLAAFSAVGDDRTELLSVEDVLDEALGIVHNELRHKATLVKDVQVVARIRGNARRLQQALLNVLVNATEAIPTADAGQNRIRIGIRPDGDWIVVEVEDSGLGIAAEHLPRIFDPFFTTKRVGTGSGLGLTMTHDIISSHGGRIDVSSEPGAGTKVTIRLPAAESPSLVPPAPPLPETPARLRVLLVDDEAPIRKSYRRALGGDFDLDEAVDGNRAIGILSRDRGFDVILCDLHMPGKSGAALYREVCDRWPDLEPRFLFITGGAFTEETKEFAKRLGPRCLVKPISTSTLVERIRQVVKG